VRASYLRAAKSDPTQGPTIAECVGDHLATKSRGMKKRTLQQNEYVLNQLVKCQQSHPLARVRDIKVAGTQFSFLGPFTRASLLRSGRGDLFPMPDSLSI
jgi:hypothetical protein